MSARERVPCLECGVPGRSLRPESYVCTPCMRGEVANGLPPGRWELRKGIQHFVPDVIPDPVEVVRPLKLCGTPAAAKRHRYRNEPLCDDCRESERLRHSKLRQRRANNHQMKESA